jgi:hypothetical protein
MHQLLPYLEQMSLWNRWDRFNFGNNERDPPMPSGIRNGPGAFTKQPVPTLICPSQPNASFHWNVPSNPAASNARLYFLTSYYGCAGTRSFPRGPLSDGRLSFAAFRDGVFDLNVARPLGAILDGTAFTIMFGERHYYDPVFDRFDPLVDWGWVWFGGQADAWLGTSVRINYRIPEGTTLNAAITDDRLNAFGSGHPQGANFTLADASVQFIRDTISPVVFQALGTRDKAEPIAGNAL